MSDLELADFSAADLLGILAEKGLDTPVIVIKGTGAEEIAFRCLESGRCQFYSLHARLSAQPATPGCDIASASRGRKGASPARNATAGK